MPIKIQSMVGGFTNINTSGATSFEVEIPDMFDPDTNITHTTILPNQLSALDNALAGQTVTAIRDGHKIHSEYGNKLHGIATINSSTLYHDFKIGKFSKSDIQKNIPNFKIAMEDYTKAMRHAMFLKNIEESVLTGFSVNSIGQLQAFFSAQNVKHINNKLAILPDSQFYPNVNEAVKNGHDVTLDDVAADLQGIAAHLNNNSIIAFLKSNNIVATPFTERKNAVRNEYPMHVMDISFTQSDIASAISHMQAQGKNLNAAQVHEEIRKTIIEWARQEPVSVLYSNGPVVNVSPSPTDIYARRAYAISNIQTSGSAILPHYNVIVGGMITYRHPISGLVTVTDLDNNNIVHSTTRLADMLQKSFGINLGTAAISNKVAQTQVSIVPTATSAPVVPTATSAPAVPTTTTIPDDIVEDIEEQPVNLTDKYSVVNNITRSLGIEKSQFSQKMAFINNLDTAPVLNDLQKEASVKQSELTDIQAEIVRLQTIEREKQSAIEALQNSYNTAQKFELMKSQLKEMEDVVTNVMTYLPMVESAQQLYADIAQYQNLVDLRHIDDVLLAELQQSNPDATTVDIDPNVRANVINERMQQAMALSNDIVHSVNDILTQTDIVPADIDFESKSIVEQIDIIKDSIAAIREDNIRIKTSIIEKDECIETLNANIDELTSENEELSASHNTLEQRLADMEKAMAAMQVQHQNELAQKDVAHKAALEAYISNAQVTMENALQEQQRQHENVVSEMQDTHLASIRTVREQAVKDTTRHMQQSLRNILAVKFGSKAFYDKIENMEPVDALNILSDVIDAQENKVYELEALEPRINILTQKLNEAEKYAAPARQMLRTFQNECGYKVDDSDGALKDFFHLAAEQTIMNVKKNVSQAQASRSLHPDEEITDEEMDNIIRRRENDPDNGPTL